MRSRSSSTHFLPLSFPFAGRYGIIGVLSSLSLSLSGAPQSACSHLVHRDTCPFRLPVLRSPSGNKFPLRVLISRSATESRRCTSASRRVPHPAHRTTSTPDTPSTNSRIIKLQELVTHKLSHRQEPASLCLGKTSRSSQYVLTSQNTKLIIRDMNTKQFIPQTV